eukprot:COSAG01_NODE_687_length_14245_cov_40.399548_21_plen_117_part_00
MGHRRRRPAGLGLILEHQPAAQLLADALGILQLPHLRTQTPRHWVAVARGWMHGRPITGRGGGKFAHVLVGLPLDRLASLALPPRPRPRSHIRQAVSCRAALMARRARHLPATAPQ